MKEKFSFIFKCDVFFSAIALLLSLPFFKWIRIDEVQKSYNAFDILSYVQDSGHGMQALKNVVNDSKSSGQHTVMSMVTNRL